MSTDENTIAPWQPQLLSEAVFSPDFEPIDGEDPGDVGAILASIMRLATNAAVPLKLGELRSFTSWGLGRGVTFRRDRATIKYRLLKEVTAWEDVDDEFKYNPGEKVFDSSISVFSPRPELTQILNEHKLIAWFAYRNHKTNTWTHNVKKHIVDRELIKKACLGMFQVDLILNAQQFPRKRLCSQYEKGRMWLWIGKRGDYLVAATNKVNNIQQLSQIARLGESFVIS